MQGTRIDCSLCRVIELFEILWRIVYMFELRLSISIRPDP